jgi:hypothetical protein
MRVGSRDEAKHEIIFQQSNWLGYSALTQATWVRAPVAEFWPVKPTSTCVELIHMLGSDLTAVVLVLLGLERQGKNTKPLKAYKRFRIGGSMNITNRLRLHPLHGMSQTAQCMLMMQHINTSTKSVTALRSEAFPRMKCEPGPSPLGGSCQNYCHALHGTVTLGTHEQVYACHNT